MAIAYQIGGLGVYQLFTPPNNGSVGPRRSRVVSTDAVIPGAVIGEEQRSTRTLPRFISSGPSYRTTHPRTAVGVGRLNGLGNLGRIGNPLCSEHSDLLNQLDNMVGEADRQGYTGLEYNQAKTYLARFDGFSIVSPYPVLPSTCTSETAQARAIYTALAKALNVSINPPPPQPSDIVGTIKTVAIVAAIIAGVVAVAPVIWEVVGMHKAKRLLK